MKGKRVYVGIDVSKRKNSVHVRSEGMMTDRLTTPADYEVLMRYFGNNYPECEIRVMYEAGFSGFGLHDYLSGKGIRCIVTPPFPPHSGKVLCGKTRIADCRRRSSF